MTELEITPNFTVDDIHKIREYNHEKTSKMNFEERLEYYRNGASIVEREIANQKKQSA